MVPYLQELSVWWRRSTPRGVCHNVIWHASGHKGAHVSLPGRLRRQGADAEPGPESTEEPGWGEGTETHSLGEGQLVTQRLVGAERRTRNHGKHALVAAPEKTPTELALA